MAILKKISVEEYVLDTIEKCITYPNLNYPEHEIKEEGNGIIFHMENIIPSTTFYMDIKSLKQLGYKGIEFSGAGGNGIILYIEEDIDENFYIKINTIGSMYMRIRGRLKGDIILQNLYLVPTTTPTLNWETGITSKNNLKQVLSSVTNIDFGKRGAMVLDVMYENENEMEKLTRDSKIHNHLSDIYKGDILNFISIRKGNKGFLHFDLKNPNNSNFTINGHPK